MRKSHPDRNVNLNENLFHDKVSAIFQMPDKKR
jgi:hypothetical protein